MKSFTMMLAACLAAAATPATAATVITGATGGGEAFDNMQPSLALGQYVQTQGSYPRTPENGGTPVNGFLGQIRTFAFQGLDRFPGAAQGQLLPIASNQALYTILKLNFGSDGQRDFGLPNLAGATMVGTGQGESLFNYQIGYNFGKAATTLTVAEMAAHSHGVAGGPPTTLTGSSEPIDNRQPSLAITYGIVADGSFGAAAGTTPVIGQIMAFGGDFSPNGLLAADGQELRIAEYSALFAAIGTNYGGDGVTTFRLPDLRGRTAVGASAIGDATHVALALGQKGGDESTKLTTANLPAHDHDLPGGGETGLTGAGEAFSNVQPSLGLNYIISLQGLFPGNGEPMAEDFYLGEVTLFAGGAIPENWALAQGQLLNIRDYGALFSLLGFAYGGDGFSTFALPDLRGRTVIGAGSAYQVGGVYGTTSVRLTEDNVPSHYHLVNVEVAGVPEPATWATMIAGFGLIGGGLRRQARAAAKA